MNEGTNEREKLEETLIVPSQDLWDFPLRHTADTSELLAKYKTKEKVPPQHVCSDDIILPPSLLVVLFFLHISLVSFSDQHILNRASTKQNKNSQFYI